MNPEPETHTSAVTIAATLAFLTYWNLIVIVPKFDAAFEDFLPGKPLPPFTEITLAVSRIAGSLGGLIAAVMLLGLIVIGFMHRHSTVTANAAYAGIVVFLLFGAIAALGLYVPQVPFSLVFGHP